MNQKIQKAIKRSLDILLAFISLLLLFPLFLIISALIKLTSGSPVFFKWKIIGQDEKEITSYKFRTMVPNAESIEEKFRKEGRNEMNDIYFKLKDDPRITPIGKFLRKFSIDEFPELLSVLKGDMSLVGPCPVRIHEYKELNEMQKRRFEMKPGMTSLWVISGKNKIKSFDEINRLDVTYIDNWSLWLDLKILAKTAIYIITGKNY